MRVPVSRGAFHDGGASFDTTPVPILYSSNLLSVILLPLLILLLPLLLLLLLLETTKLQ